MVAQMRERRGYLVIVVQPVEVHEFKTHVQICGLNLARRAVYYGCDLVGCQKVFFLDRGPTWTVSLLHGICPWGLH